MEPKLSFFLCQSDFVQGSFNQLLIDFFSSHTSKSLNVQQSDSPVNKGNRIQTMHQFLFQFVKLLPQYQLTDDGRQVMAIVHLDLWSR
jgi:hypothetical protein